MSLGVVKVSVGAAMLGCAVRMVAGKAARGLVVLLVALTPLSSSPFAQAHDASAAGLSESTPIPAASEVPVGVGSEKTDDLADAQERAHSIKALLRETVGERFLRVQTVHTPSFHVVLTITAGPVPEEVQALADSAAVPVTIATYDGLPLDDFLGAVDSSWAEFAGTDGLASQDADPATQTITFYFNPDSGTSLNDFATAVTDHLNDRRITVVAEEFEDEALDHPDSD